MGTALVERAPFTETDASDAAGSLGSGAVPAGLPPSPPATGSRARVLDATGRRLARFGLSKTTLEDVAREARLSRATLYRLFPGGRDELFAAFVAREATRLFADLGRELGGARTLEDVAARFLTALSGHLADHGALATVLEHEPELVLPYVSFSGLDRMLALFAEFLEPFLVDRSARTFGRGLEPEDARRAGEWLGRLALSYMACPDGLPDLAPVPPGPRRDDAFSRMVLRPARITEDRARALVGRFVVPGLRHLVGKQLVHESPLQHSVPDQVQ